MSYPSCYSSDWYAYDVPVADVRASQGMRVRGAFSADSNDTVEAASDARLAMLPGAPLLASHQFAGLHPIRDRPRKASPPNCRH